MSPSPAEESDDDIPMDVPKISPKLNSPGDVVKLRKAVQFINNAMEKPGLAQFHPRSLRGLETMTAAELDATIHKHGQEFYHPSGTCKMGDPIKDESVVVDSHCRVVGIQGLRVADASIHPTEITVAICAGCIVAGEKCAAMSAGAHTHVNTCLCKGPKVFGSSIVRTIFLRMFFTLT